MYADVSRSLPLVLSLLLNVLIGKLEKSPEQTDSGALLRGPGLSEGVDSRLSASLLSIYRPAPPALLAKPIASHVLLQRYLRTIGSLELEEFG